MVLNVLIKKVREYRIAGRFNDALFLLDSSLKKTKKSLFYELQAEKALLFLEIEQKQVAKDLLHDLYESRSSIHMSPISKGITLAGLAQFELQRCRLSKAFSFIQEALKIDLEDVTIKVDILLVFCEILAKKCEYKKQAQILEKIIEICSRPNEYNYGLGIAYLKYAKLILFHTKKSHVDLNRIHTMLRNSLKHFQACESKVGLIQYYKIKGDIRYKLGNNNQAKLNYSKAISISLDIDSELKKYTIPAKYGIILVQSKLGEISSALKKMKKILKSPYLKENKLLRVAISTSLAKIHRDQLDDYKRSLQLFKRGIKTLETCDVEENFVTIIFEACKTMLNAKEFYPLKEIEILINDAARLAQKHKSPIEEIKVAFLFAMLEKAENNPMESINILDQILPKAIEFIEPDLALEILFHLLLIAISHPTGLKVSQLKTKLDKVISFFDSTSNDLDKIYCLLVKSILLTINDSSESKSTIDEALALSRHHSFPMLIDIIKRLRFDIIKLEETFPAEFKYLRKYILTKIIYQILAQKRSNIVCYIPLRLLVMFSTFNNEINLEYKSIYTGTNHPYSSKYKNLLDFGNKVISKLLKMKKPKQSLIGPFEYNRGEHFFLYPMKYEFSDSCQVFYLGLLVDKDFILFNDKYVVNRIIKVKKNLDTTFIQKTYKEELTLALDTLFDILTKNHL